MEGTVDKYPRDPRPCVVDVRFAVVRFPPPDPTATPFKYKTPPVSTKFPKLFCVVSRKKMEDNWILLVNNWVYVDAKDERYPIDPSPTIELWREAVEMNVEGTVDKYPKDPRPIVVLVSSETSINPTVVLRS